MFGRKTPTLTKPEATPGDRIDLRILGQNEESCLLNEKQPKVFLISSLMKQVLKSPNTENAEKVDYYLVSYGYSEIHAQQKRQLGTT